jgi:hypothetical protein
MSVERLEVAASGLSLVMCAFPVIIVFIVFIGKSGIFQKNVENIPDQLLCLL